MRIIPTWILESYPWVSDIGEWLTWLKELWHESQSLFVLFAFWLLWWFLRRERVILSERIETLRQIVTAVRDQSEEALAQPSSNGAVTATPNGANQTPATLPGSGIESWERVRALWRDARDRMELAIENISRSSVRGKYGKLPRYRYEEVIVHLRRDGILTDRERNELLRMDASFSRYKFKPKAITPEEALSFEESYHMGTKSLPLLPEQDLPLNLESGPAAPLPTFATARQTQDQPRPAA